MKVRELVELLEGLNLDQEASVVMKIGSKVRRVSGVNSSDLGEPQICVYPHKEDT